MSLYSIYGTDSLNSNTKRIELRELHLQYLRDLNQQGKLFAAGPLMNSETNDATPNGSLLIVDFGNIELAKAWFDEEPYNKAGVYQNVEIKLYIDALPNC